MAKNQKQGPPFIIAFMLSEESRAALKALATLNMIYGEHLTLKFRPTNEELAEYETLIDQPATFCVKGMASDDCAQAVLVELPDGVKSQNKFPHITISCSEGTRPFHSNKMIETASANGEVKPLEMHLLGIIKKIHLNNLPKPTKK